MYKVNPQIKLISCTGGDLYVCLLCHIFKIQNNRKICDLWQTLAVKLLPITYTNANIFAHILHVKLIARLVIHINT